MSGLACPGCLVPVKLAPPASPECAGKPMLHQIHARHRPSKASRAEFSRAWTCVEAGGVFAWPGARGLGDSFDAQAPMPASAQGRHPGSGCHCRIGFDFMLSRAEPAVSDMGLADVDLAGRHQPGLPRHAVPPARKGAPDQCHRTAERLPFCNAEHTRTNRSGQTVRCAWRN